MESWKRVWRDGVAPLLSDAALLALQGALAADDAELVHGATTTPPPLSTVAEWPVEGACLIGYCGWRGEGLETVGQVEEFFARMCHDIDQRMGEPAGCRWLLNWFDETPRAEMQVALLAEVNRTCQERFGDDDRHGSWFDDDPPRAA
jgi:hypothetical protein